MDIINNLIYGFSVCFQPENLLFCFIGAVLGTLIGVLPGIGPVGAISLLLPVTFKMSPIGATIMLAGIYYGSMYGGSITSILVNIPGEAASIVTCLDGYQMARKGRAGPALGIAAFGSFIAGTLGLVGLVIFCHPPRPVRFAVRAARVLRPCSAGADTYHLSVPRFHVQDHYDGCLWPHFELCGS